MDYFNAMNSHTLFHIKSDGWMDGWMDGWTDGRMDAAHNP